MKRRSRCGSGADFHELPEPIKRVRPLVLSLTPLPEPSNSVDSVISLAFACGSIGIDYFNRSCVSLLSRILQIPLRLHPNAVVTQVGLKCISDKMVDTELARLQSLKIENTSTSFKSVIHSRSELLYSFIYLLYNLAKHSSTHFLLTFFLTYLRFYSLLLSHILVPKNSS